MNTTRPPCDNALFWESTSQVPTEIPCEFIPPSTVCRGWCSVCNTEHTLASDESAKLVAAALLRSLIASGAINTATKYGVLVGVRHDGTHGFIKACADHPSSMETQGWLPPIPIQLKAVRELRETLRGVDQMTRQVAQTGQERSRLEVGLTAIRYRHERALNQIRQFNRDRKDQRASTRNDYASENGPPAHVLATLQMQSMGDGAKLKNLKQRQRIERDPIEAEYHATANLWISLRQARRGASQTLQKQLLGLVLETPAPGETFAQQNTHHCAASDVALKLLFHAARTGVRAQSICLFDWPSKHSNPGFLVPSVSDARVNTFGDMLCGLQRPRITHEPADFSTDAIDILYADEHVIAVNKPAGLISVPGRHWTTADNVTSRLNRRYNTRDGIMLVHRLDQETSGVMIFARTRAAQKALSKQFMRRVVQKTYLALLDGVLTHKHGSITLPLSSDTAIRPRQRVDQQTGKHAETHFQVLRSSSRHSLIELKPVTGRTHQLRVHCADSRGLNMPIRGDDIYGQRQNGERLYLHAHRLQLTHPATGGLLSFTAPPPF